MTPAQLTRVFFTNSGSEANDTVVKLVWYYNNALGRPKKKKFLARSKGYHGITVASGSLTGLPNNHRDFDLPAIPVRHLTCPHFYRFGKPGESEAQFTARLLAEAETVILEEGPDTIAAFIGEPLMAAGGVMPPPAGYWPGIEALCRKYDILLVSDEVINGFGRIGSAFGARTTASIPTSWWSPSSSRLRTCRWPRCCSRSRCTRRSPTTPPRSAPSATASRLPVIRWQWRSRSRTSRSSRSAT